MKYISRQPPEYVQCVQAIKAWIENEYQLYQLPTMLHRIIRMALNDRLHVMVDDLIRYNVKDLEQLSAWDNLPTNELVASFFETPYHRIITSKLFGAIEAATIDGNPLSSMLYQPGYELLENGILTAADSNRFIDDIAYNTSEIIQSAIDYYRPMETLHAHYRQPVRIVNPDNASTIVDDPRRIIILRVE